MSEMVSKMIFCYENLPLCFAGKCKHDRTNGGGAVCQSFPAQKTQGFPASSHRGQIRGYRQRPPNLADIGRQPRLRGQRNLANLKFHAYYLEGGVINI